MVEYFTEIVGNTTLQYVKPYMHEYRTYWKERWRNTNLLETFSREFKLFSPEYYQYAIENEYIKVNGQKIDTDYIIKNGDLITHATMKHEPPILAKPIEILLENEEVVVVSKPPSMPVHACGAYFNNSLQRILMNKNGFTGLRPIYRIDRVTSGLVMFGRTHEVARELQGLIQDKGAVTKKYLAKVGGEFPHETLDLEKPISWVDHQNSRYQVDEENGKPSHTLFRKIHYDPEDDMTLLEAQPLTGRTHQIRVHLQHLGYSIINDQAYGGREVDVETIPFSEGYKKIKFELGEHKIPLGETK